MNSPALALRPYFVARRPKWAEREANPNYIAQQMLSSGRQKSCPFCNGDTEKPIKELPHSRILSVRSPYVPQHALFVPKEHSETLATLSEGAMGDLCVFAKALFRFDAGMALIINQGLAGGQSISHFHAHALPLNTPQRSTVRIAHPNLAFNDPLSAVLLHNATGAFTPEFPRVHRVPIPLDMPHLVSVLSSATFGVLNIAFRLAKIDFPVMEIPPIYKKYPGAKERLEMLFKTHSASELGMNWCIRMHEGTPVLEALPRPLALNVTNEGRSSIGSYEPFCNTTAQLGGISEQEAIVWEQEAGRFFTQLKAALR